MLKYQNITSDNLSSLIREKEEELLKAHKSLINFMLESEDKKLSIVICEAKKKEKWFREYQLDIFEIKEIINRKAKNTTSKDIEAYESRYNKLYEDTFKAQTMCKSFYDSLKQEEIEEIRKQEKRKSI